MAGENHYIDFRSSSLERLDFSTDFSNISEPSQTFATDELNPEFRSEYEMLMALVNRMSPYSVEFRGANNLAIVFEDGTRVGFVGFNYLSYQKPQNETPVIYGPLPVAVRKRKKGKRL